MIKKIAVVTGSRAEYGLLFWTLKQLQKSSNCELQLIVTGSHLSPTYDFTINNIIDDGFKIDWQVDLLVDGDTSKSIAKSVGLGVIGFTDAFTHLNPDIIVLLGDRYEILAAAQAAFFLKIPIAHLHGGEVTTGALDDSIRHAITKLSSLHFVSAEPYRKRVVQLGELPSCTHHVGAPGLEHLINLTLYNKESFQEHYRFKLGTLNFLIVYHPVTAYDEPFQDTLTTIFSILSEYKDAKFIVTGTNADEGGRRLMKHIINICGGNDKILFVNSFGQLGILSAIHLCDVMIGNSSSGIIEAPSLGTPTVNIGIRQKGRIRSPSIIDCDPTKESIRKAVRKALTPEFQAIAEKKQNACAEKGLEISKQIVDVLLNTDLSGLKTKGFYDLVQ